MLGRGLGEGARQVPVKLLEREGELYVLAKSERAGGQGVRDASACAQKAPQKSLTEQRLARIPVN